PSADGAALTGGLMEDTTAHWMSVSVDVGSVSSVSLGELSPARMRTLSALLVVVLLICSLQQTCGGISVQDASKECCSKLTKLEKIPVRRIVSYWRTSTNCPLPAVVFQMVTEKCYCVDPELDWVKSHMKAVDQRPPSTTTAKPKTPCKF
ncbi:hypothetical protein NFI96_027636, partial [Prochilodus magdalenae]